MSYIHIKIGNYNIYTLLKYILKKIKIGIKKNKDP